MNKLEAWLRVAVGPRRGIAVWLGVAAAVVGSLAPWSGTDGTLGRTAEAASPGGARVFVLLLALVALIVLTDASGRRRAGLAAAAGSATIAAGAAVVSLGVGEGVSWGAGLALIGGLDLLASAASLPDDPSPPPPRRQPVWIEYVALAVSALVALAVVVIGLRIEEAGLFSAYLVFVVAVSNCLRCLGVLAWLRAASERHRGVGIALAALVAAVFPFTQGGNAYWIRVLASVGVFAAAAIGLNVVVGLAGLLDLGYVAFFGVGAYVGALFADAALTTVNVHLPFLLVVVLGALIAAMFGVAIGAPTLRLRGDYLAIVTLGFGEIFRIAAFNLDWLTRGPNGISGIPDLALGGFHFGEGHTLLGVELPSFANYYAVELLLLAVVAGAFHRLNDSRIGRAWVAIREDETAAAAMGIDTTRLKLLAFGIGAFMAGAAGTVNSHVTSQVSPDSYTFLESILLLAAVVLGGMGTVGGALLGSVALFVIPEKLRSFADARLLLFGAALVLMMRFRPEGILPSHRRARELHDAEEVPGPSSG
ncbi:MAG: branched-chain amino acid ABC transporter permease, partial [Actinomycetota bacterium]|nr:branched-chain amino acid ABC transporter permease [Actinomycetota bacterium]